jgi:hypothetical protein
MSRIKDEIIKINHPDNDGTYVIFTNPTPRQKEVLLDYLSYTTKLSKSTLNSVDDWYKGVKDER